MTSKSHDAVDLAWGVLPTLRDLFDVVIAAEDTERHKPDAAPLLEALQRLGAGPEGACYVGDAPFDMLAGQGRGPHHHRRDVGVLPAPRAADAGAGPGGRHPGGPAARLPGDGG